MNLAPHRGLTGEGKERRFAVKSTFIGAPRATGEILEMAERLPSLTEAGAALACDAGALPDPDCAMVEALARLQLAARRLGSTVRLRHVRPELHDMLSLAGLCDVIGCSDDGPAAADISGV